MKIAAATAAVGGVLMIVSIFLAWDKPSFESLDLSYTPSTTFSGLDLIDNYVDTRDDASFLSKFDPRLTGNETYGSATIQTPRGGGFVLVTTILLGALAILLALLSLRASPGSGFAIVVAVLAVAWIVYVMLWSGKNVETGQIGAWLALVGGLVVLGSSATAAVLARRRT